MRQESKRWQWLAAVSAAVAAHVLFMVGYAGLNPYGAVGEGQGGIEIGLGMLGEMGESRESSDAREMPALPTEPRAEPPPPEAPQPEVPQPQPQPAPQTLQAEPVQQVTEVAVQSETSEQVADLEMQFETREQLTDSAVETETSEPAAELPSIEPGNTLAAVMPSEGGSAGAESVTRRRTDSGAGDSPGAGGTRGRQATYVATLAAQLNRYKHYPMAARRARQEGTATLSLLVLRDGSVKDSSISESSGWEALDAAVLRMLERAQPLPAFPASMEEEEIRVKIPVSFSLNPL